MEYSKKFLARDKSRKLLTRGLSHDYKRVLATLSRRIDEIKQIFGPNEDRWLVTQCDLLKSTVRKISHTLDDIGDAIDNDPNRPATSVVAEFRATILRDIRDLSNYSAHVQSKLDQNPSSTKIDLSSQCLRAERQIKSLINLPFKEQDISYRPINVKNETNRIIEDLYDLLQKHDVDRRQIANNLSSTIATDQLLFTICMSNILTNSIVHSGKQRDLLITIDERNSVIDDRAFINISTSDNGVGISPEDAKIVFHLFKQGSRAPASEGNGVGLPFARAAAHMLGGELALAESTKVGATFILSLPREPLS